MQSPKMEADLIIKNANIYTVDDDFSIASVIAIKNGDIISVGGDEILNDYVSTKLINAEGNFIYPGFNDGHSHFLGYGVSLIKYADLIGTTSFEEVIERVKKHNDEFPSQWILGRGWDQNDWEFKDFPDNNLLNELFPDQAVVLIRIDGHAVLANDFALKIIGYDENTKIEGGELLKKNGKLTGVLVDAAAYKMKNAIPALTKLEKELALIKAQENCFAKGLT
ncbi:MAG: amidohydrolase, partial [Marinilabiliales bacterium]